MTSGKVNGTDIIVSSPPYKPLTVICFATYAAQSGIVALEYFPLMICLYINKLHMGSKVLHFFMKVVNGPERAILPLLINSLS